MKSCRVGSACHSTPVLSGRRARRPDPQERRRAHRRTFVHESHALGHRLRDRQLSISQRRRRACRWSSSAAASPGCRPRGGSAGGAFTISSCSKWSPRPGATPGPAANQVSAYPWAAHYVPVPGPQHAARARVVRATWRFRGRPMGASGICATRRRSGCSCMDAGKPGSSRRWDPPHAIAITSTRFERRMAEFAAPERFTVPMGDALAATPLDGDLDGAVAVRARPRLALVALARGLRVPRRLRRPRERHGRVGRNPLLRLACSGRRPGRSPGPRATAWITKRLLAMAGDTREDRPGGHASGARRPPLVGLHARRPLDGRGRDLRGALVSGGACDRGRTGRRRTSSIRPGSRPTSRSIAGRRNAARRSRGTT